MARPPDAVVSAATLPWAGPPWPVRANSKSAGAAPTVILSRAIMMTPVWVRPAVVAQAMAPATAAAKMGLLGKDVKSLRWFTCNLLMQLFRRWGSNTVHQRTVIHMGGNSDE